MPSNLRALTMTSTPVLPGCSTSSVRPRKQKHHCTEPYWAQVTDKLKNLCGWNSKNFQISKLSHKNGPLSAGILTAAKDSPASMESH
jgi:outer membrane biogenesis lipoprotein LolB